MTTVGGYSPSKQDFPKSLRWSLRISLIGHGILFLIALLSAIVLPSRTVPYVPTLKVDLVALPDILKKDLDSVRKSNLNKDISKILKEAERNAQRIAKEKPIPHEEKQVEKKTENEIGLKKESKKSKGTESAKESGKDSVKNRNKLALQRIKALAKIHDLDAKQNAVIKGNKLSPGTSLSGEAKENLGTEYFGLIQDKLKEYWELPPWIARQDLSAQVKIFIDKRGTLKNVKFIKVSGNAQFDDAVKRALKESEPFPAPPEQLISQVLSDGILVGFPL